MFLIYFKYIKKGESKGMAKYDKLRNLREDNDMTQAELGKKLNISQRTYAHYEAGTRDIPVETLIKLADIYDVSLDFLVGRNSIRRNK